jgi:Zn-dependent protease with chaperone function
MIETTVQYFNGKFATPYQVRIEVDQDSIQLFDASYNSDNGICFPFSKCHYIVLKENAFIYLNQGSTEYIIISLNNEYYQQIISGIKKSQKGLYDSLMRQKWYTLLLIVALLISLVYLLLDKAVPPIALKLISVKQEISLGNEFYSSFTANEEIDSSKTFILQKFANDLTLSDQYPIRVTVVKDSIVNAFALPGGHLVVYTGIIKKLENPEELIALLSHEASHVNQRHSLKSILSRLTSSFIISLFTKDISGLSRGLIDNVNMLRVLSYSRELETEADNEGMKLMLRNKVNPIGMKFLMEDLQKLHNDIPHDISFLSTHPLTEERIKNTESFLKNRIQLNEPLNDELNSLWRELKENE